MTTKQLKQLISGLPDNMEVKILQVSPGIGCAKAFSVHIDIDLNVITIEGMQEIEPYYGEEG